MTTPVGGTSTATHDFTYTRTAPTISSVTPSTGKASGGQHVKITGSNFKTVTTTGVEFGATPATSYTVTSTTQITAVTPSGSGSVAVTVKTAGGTSTNTHTFTYVAAPAITSLTPASGKATATHAVKITGSNFTTVTSVTVGGTAATIGAHTGTQITVTAPAKAAGSYAVVVTTPVGGTSTATHDFTYIPAPTVTSFTPASGTTLGGTTVTIIGTNLGGATTVKFGTTPATTFQVTGTTKIVAKTDPHAAGTVTISVTTPGGTATSGVKFGFVALVWAHDNDVEPSIRASGPVLQRDRECHGGQDPLPVVGDDTSGRAAHAQYRNDHRHTDDAGEEDSYPQGDEQRE